MICPKCGKDALIFGAFSQENKLRAACLECHLFWEIDENKILLKELKLVDKRK